MTTTVWAVETGAYSDYRIDSLWSTQELAQARADLLSQSGRAYDPIGVVEWTIDDPEVSAERLVYEITGYINRFTGVEYRQRFGPRPTVTSKPCRTERHFAHPTSIAGKHGDCDIIVRAETEERARKVLSEQLAQIKAQIDQTGPLTDERK